MPTWNWQALPPWMCTIILCSDGMRQANVTCRTGDGELAVRPICLFQQESLRCGATPSSRFNEPCQVGVPPTDKQPRAARRSTLKRASDPTLTNTVQQSLQRGVPSIWNISISMCPRSSIVCEALQRGVEIVAVMPAEAKIPEALIASGSFKNFTLAGIAGLGHDGQRKPV